MTHIPVLPWPKRFTSITVNTGNMAERIDMQYIYNYIYSVRYIYFNISLFGVNMKDLFAFTNHDLLKQPNYSAF